MTTKNEKYLSSFIFGIDNNSISTPLKYDKTISSDMGKIGLIKRFDDYEYWDIYFNNMLICDAEIEVSDNEIINLVKENL